MTSLIRTLTCKLIRESFARAHAPAKSGFLSLSLLKCKHNFIVFNNSSAMCARSCCDVFHSPLAKYASLSPFFCQSAAEAIEIEIINRMDHSGHLEFRGRARGGECRKTARLACRCPSRYRADDATPTPFPIQLLHLFPCSRNRYNGS